MNVEPHLMFLVMEGHASDGLEHQDKDLGIRFFAQHDRHSANVRALLWLEIRNYVSKVGEISAQLARYWAENANEPLFACISLERPTDDFSAERMNLAFTNAPITVHSSYHRSLGVITLKGER